MNYATIKEFDTANGVGVRVSLYVSGCTHHCKGCFNKETWDFCYGKPYTKEEENKIIEACKKPYIKGLSVLGGEPFEKANQKDVASLMQRFKKECAGKDIWCYSGYTFDKDMMPSGKIFSPHVLDMLDCIDYLVDGEFVEEKKNLKLKFRGSENQRIIDVQRTLCSGKVVCLNDFDEKLT